jgi:glutathione synthase/RimK-type ligase-like ATP-grasp enzyme
MLSNKVLVCGIISESPVKRIINELVHMNVPVIVFYQRQVEYTSISYKINKGVKGRMDIQEAGFNLDDIGGVYTRLIDDRVLPELKNETADSPSLKYSFSFHQLLSQWMEVTNATVVNKVSAMQSNGSKPFQAQYIRQSGFHIPETLITTDPENVLSFRRQHKRIIFKSMSGIRSIVREFNDDDVPRLPLIKNCPLQFQQYIDGFHVRAHVIGRRVIATSIHSDATDYRYASSYGKTARLNAYKLNDDLAERCVTLSRSLGLNFSGIDLKFSPDGKIYCFEVNPSPGYSYYEANTGQQIARTVAEYLSGKTIYD